MSLVVSQTNLHQHRTTHEPPDRTLSAFILVPWRFHRPARGPLFNLLARAPIPIVLSCWPSAADRSGKRGSPVPPIRRRIAWDEAGQEAFVEGLARTRFLLRFDNRSIAAERWYYRGDGVKPRLAIIQWALKWRCSHDTLNIDYPCLDAGT
jgi:hypothetical protein